jgi:hypothetical protein
MNQHQRKFLLEQIEKQYKAESDALRGRRSTALSLNNYLVAAILDKTAMMRSPKEIAEKIRLRVRDLGKNDALVTNNDRGWGRKNEEAEDVISIPALILFEPPPAFAKVQEAYEQALDKWEADKKALEDSINAMRIKVQVGSDKALEALVEQADKLCSMSLTTSSRLLLPTKAS